MNDTLRVVIADDQEIVRSGLRLILEAHGIEVVGEASDGRAAVELARAADTFDVVSLVASASITCASPGACTAVGQSAYFTVVLIVQAASSAVIGVPSSQYDFHSPCWRPPS